MSYANKISADTKLYAQVGKISMTESEREEAIYALDLGEGIADTISWIFNGVERAFGCTTPNPVSSSK